MSEFLRGHKIEEVNGDWCYSDDKTPARNYRDHCGHCGKSDTPEGHDGCLGTIPNAMNACCGHGSSYPYVQFYNGESVFYSEAERVQKGLSMYEIPNRIRLSLILDIRVVDKVSTPIWLKVKEINRPLLNFIVENELKSLLFGVRNNEIT